MPASAQASSLHGVMISLDGIGVLLTGKAGSGKSSLALELLWQGYQLVADDVVELVADTDAVYAHCPPMLSGLLHSRELGLIDIKRVFGAKALKSRQRLDLVVELAPPPNRATTLDAPLQSTTLLDKDFPLLYLSPQNPASLANRLLTWLKIQASGQDSSAELNQRQQHWMTRHS